MKTFIDLFLPESRFPYQMNEETYPLDYYQEWVAYERQVYHSRGEVHYSDQWIEEDETSSFTFVNDFLKQVYTELAKTTVSEVLRNLDMSHQCLPINNEKSNYESTWRQEDARDLADWRALQQKEDRMQCYRRRATNSAKAGLGLGYLE